MAYGYRSKTERTLLQAEAERLVRAGQSRADVARALGLSMSTLAQWAGNGGWRWKDIEQERASEIAADVGRRIAEAEEARKRACEAEAVVLTPVVDPGSVGLPGIAEPEAFDPVNAAKACLRRAAGLAAAGRVEEAERAARMGERFLRAGALLKRIEAGLEGPAGADGEAVSELDAAYEAELREMLTIKVRMLEEQEAWRRRLAGGTDGAGERDVSEQEEGLRIADGSGVMEKELVERPDGEDAWPGRS